jgi:hypothetical protein
MLTETSIFKRANPRFRGINLRRASASFQHGLVARVAARLDATKLNICLYVFVTRKFWHSNATVRCVNCFASGRR